MHESLERRQSVVTCEADCVDRPSCGTGSLPFASRSNRREFHWSNESQSIPAVTECWCTECNEWPAKSLSHVTWNLDNETVWMRFQVNYSDYSMAGYEQRQHSIHFSVADGRITIFLIELRCCVNLNGSIAKWMTRLHVLSQDLTHILSPKWPPETTMQLISLSWLHQSQWMRMKLFPSSLTPDIRMNFFSPTFQESGCRLSRGVKRFSDRTSRDVGAGVKGGRQVAAKVPVSSKLRKNTARWTGP